FTTDLGLPQTFQPPTGTLAVQIGANVYPVESVGPYSAIGGSYIVFRLPDLTPGTYPLGIRLNGVNSANSPNLIIIASPASSVTPEANKVKLAEYVPFPLINLFFLMTRDDGHSLYLFN